MLFTRFANQSARSLPTFSCSLPLPEMCQNFLGFLPCLPGGGGISLGSVSHSWQLESCWCSRSQTDLLFPQPPFEFRCWPTTCSQDWSCGLPTLLKSFAEPAQSFTANVLNVHVEFVTNRRKVCFPLHGPQNVRKARFLCGWILGSLRVKSSNFLIQQARQGNCPLTQGGSCHNKHVRDNVSELTFLSCSCSTYFPPLPFRHFLSCMCQQATQKPLFQTQNIVVWMNESTRQTIWKHFVIIAARDPVLHSSTSTLVNNPR